VQLVKNLSIPRNRNGAFAECSMFARNYSDIVRYLEYRPPPDLVRQQAEDLLKLQPETAQVVPCQHGWHYDKSIYSSTVVQEVGFPSKESFCVTYRIFLSTHDYKQ